MTQPLPGLDPIPKMLSRLRAELPADFCGSPADRRPIRLSRAPGRLDVMGGIADYTGSLVCQATLDRAAGVALSTRDDRQVQVFSFNLFDEHQPFTFRIPLDALANNSAETLSRELNQPGRRWAGYMMGCLFILHEQGYIDLRNPGVKGLNLAVCSTVPLGAGVSSSAAVEVATMLNLVDHFGIPRVDTNGAMAASSAPPESAFQRSANGICSRVSPGISAMETAALCQAVENRIVGAPCGIMDQVAACLGEPGSLLRLVCQPHELEPALSLPTGIRFIGINSNVKHSIGAGQYGRTRCAAFMGHKIILDRMRRMGAAAGRALIADPMSGYLANLDPDDYKKLFRPYIPERQKGGEFLLQYGPTVDTVTRVEPDHIYSVQRATDHHVLEARRVRNFVAHLEQAAAAPPGTRERGSPLDKAGHLMYASHLSYTNDALLGADECDLIVKLVREREPAGLYGAKITGGGAGGTVAVLADVGPRADTAIAQVLAEYEKQTGRRPEAFTGTSPGAWHVGTAKV
jgi:L-arabinokinase